MKLIIAGGRDLHPSMELITKTLEELGWKPTLVISGCQRGADVAGEEWAKLNGIPVDPNPAEWTKYGRPAGPIRNGVMAGKGDALLAFHNCRSPGTADMIRKMKALDKPVHVVTMKGIT